MKHFNAIKIHKNDRLAIEIASKRLRHTLPIEKIILFGSKVRGDDDSESDIDLLLLTKRLITWNERKAIIDSLYDIQLDYEVIFSPFVVHSKDWYEGSFSVMPICNEILREGVLI